MDKSVDMKQTTIYSIPPSLAERNRLRSLIISFMNDHACIPPLSMERLHELSAKLIDDHALDPSCKGWIMIEINNNAWREIVGSIPFDKRILLLPKCLNNSSKCQAETDEFGLLCHRCNHCNIPDLQDKADDLGTMSIVAEGFTSVIGLIQNRVVDTVIGVGCLESLEKTFSLLIDNAVPGIAIPLNKSGCKNTTVDFDYVTEWLNFRSHKSYHLMDYDQLKAEVQSWFSHDSLSVLFSSQTGASRIAMDWMSGDGQRWRPYLLATVYQSITGQQHIPQEVKWAAVAVECFHKASLIHDDIQDNDTERYGKKTLGAIYGNPIAINIGDVLLGEGYRLLARCEQTELIRIASDAHISLCQGQGMELEWSNNPVPFTMDFVLDIFCNKTVPAFDVSLIMGVICAKGDKRLIQVLNEYSKALGIAYQLLDDIDDFNNDAPLAVRPSAVLAKLCELKNDEAFTQDLLHANNIKELLREKANYPVLQQALQEIHTLAEVYRKEALEILNDPIVNIELKRLLFRVTKRILK